MTSGTQPPQYLITGERGAGKTTFCSGLVTAVRSRHPGLLVAGILSPKVFVGGQEHAIDAVDLASGQRRRLARRRALPAATESATPRWEFDAAALAWGEGVLRSATPCALLVVDELGPLELEHGEGWPAGLQAVDGGAYRVALVVVRPTLLPPARRRWPRAQLLSVSDPEQAVAAARETAAALTPLLSRP
ncbi:MAG: hypothetical protein JW785_07805 [Acidimicrobiia bacterium]|nr:hypothetical protein [Acidimicrobiia bacterium]